MNQQLYPSLSHQIRQHVENQIIADQISTNQITTDISTTASRIWKKGYTCPFFPIDELEYWELPQSMDVNTVISLIFHCLIDDEVCGKACDVGSQGLCIYELLHRSLHPMMAVDVICDALCLFYYHLNCWLIKISFIIRSMQRSVHVVQNKCCQDSRLSVTDQP